MYERAPGLRRGAPKPGASDGDLSLRGTYVATLTTVEAAPLARLSNVVVFWEFFSLEGGS